MKIAILTQPLKSNYGGILQAFALQSTLKHLGYNPVTIDRQLNKTSKFRQTLSYLKYLTLCIKSGTKPVHFNTAEQNIIYKNTLKFIGQHIELSERISSDQEMEKHFSKFSYTAIVVGSDQTWRPKYSPNIFNFYLDFLKDDRTKRIAYASSFGVDNWEYNKPQTIKCRELAQKFDAISVREQSGVKLCSTYLNTHADSVLDPTLLLTADDYISRLKIETGNVKEQGLFTYILDMNEDKRKSINNISQQLNLNAFTNQPAIISGKSSPRNVDDYVYPKVETWIKGFHDAEFILTDSFHGCVFSIIFNKPFLAIGNPGRGLARFISLLTLFGLEDRLITRSSEISPEKINKKIDWPLINTIIEKQRKESLEFITKNLESIP